MFLIGNLCFMFLFCFALAKEKCAAESLGSCVTVTVPHEAMATCVTEKFEELLIKNGERKLELLMKVLSEDDLSEHDGPETEQLDFKFMKLIITSTKKTANLFMEMKEKITELSSNIKDLGTELNGVKKSVQFEALNVLRKQSSDLEKIEASITGVQISCSRYQLEDKKNYIDQYSHIFEILNQASNPRRDLLENLYDDMMDINETEYTLLMNELEYESDELAIEKKKGDCLPYEEMPCVVEHSKFSKELGCTWVNHTLQNWEDAKVACQSNGGVLASFECISTKEEFKNLFKDLGVPTDIWIGARLDEEVNIYKWINNIEIDMASPLWHSGEPSNGPGSNQCIQVGYTEDLMDDTQCYNLKKALCRNTA